MIENAQELFEFKSLHLPNIHISFDSIIHYLWTLELPLHCLKIEIIIKNTWYKCLTNTRRLCEQIPSGTSFKYIETYQIVFNVLCRKMSILSSLHSLSNLPYFNFSLDFMSKIQSEFSFMPTLWKNICIWMGLETFWIKYSWELCEWQSK